LNSLGIFLRGCALAVPFELCALEVAAPAAAGADDWEAVGAAMVPPALGSLGRGWDEQAAIIVAASNTMDSRVMGSFLRVGLWTVHTGLD
jgi:hypothetical protein